MVLASARDDTPIEELAQLADKIIEVAAPSISTVSSAPLTEEIDSLRKEVHSLTQLVKTLTPRGHCRTRSPSPAAPQQRSSSSETTPVLCWYHQKYGDLARKCRPPCSKSGNEQASH